MAAHRMEGGKAQGGMLGTLAILVCQSTSLPTLVLLEMAGRDHGRIVQAHQEHRGQTTDVGHMLRRSSGLLKSGARKLYRTPWGESKDVGLEESPTQGATTMKG